MRRCRGLVGLVSGLALFVGITSPAWALGLRLTWQDNSINEALFRIQRKADVCSGVVVWADLATVPMVDGTTVGPVIHDDLTGLQGRLYCYRVRAENVSGVSGWSNTAEAMFPIGPPGGVGGVGDGSPSGLGVTPLP